MKRLAWLGVLLLALTRCAPVAEPMSSPTSPQGWTAQERQAFYTRDQGSRIMPAAWMRALSRPDGQPFLGDRLARYGYLRNEFAPDSDLPIGFTTSGTGPSQAIGMTCAACHTREIVAGGQRMRIDGGPAIVDFESFLLDLKTAVDSVLADPGAFDAFAAKVNGAGAPANEALRLDVATWHRRYDRIITKSIVMPRQRSDQPLWGPGRLDAITMIFNRLTGLDIGPASNDYIIEANLFPADAPARYPFLWFAPRQDATQWLGFAPNGSTIQGLGRNLGQVYGVFAEFHPRPDPVAMMNVDYRTRNSADMAGLRQLEELVMKLDRPTFPGTVDPTLVAEGRALFGTDIDNPGQCWGCHGERAGKTQVDRYGAHQTWATPVTDARTDNRQHMLTTRLVSTGAMAGTSLPPLQRRLMPTRENPLEVLKAAVLGGILQKEYGLISGNPDAVVPSTPGARGQAETSLVSTTDAQGINQGFTTARQPSERGFPYEARVLKGIWAAAPYLHNGTVPTLDDLLKPARERPKAFRVGPNYDLAKVGLAADQTLFDTVLRTTDCRARPGWDSGNGNCGHEYPSGRPLTPGQRRALLEYLKTL